MHVCCAYVKKKKKTLQYSIRLIPVQESLHYYSLYFVAIILLRQMVLFGLKCNIINEIFIFPYIVIKKIFEILVKLSKNQTFSKELLFVTLCKKLIKVHIQMWNIPIGKDRWALAGLAITTVGVLPAIAVVTTVAGTIWKIMHHNDAYRILCTWIIHHICAFCIQILSTSLWTR